MWICSSIGFFSIVAKGGVFHVRARRRDDLTRLLLDLSLGAEILVTPRNDYRYRVILPKEDFQKCWRALGETITYNNFKDKIARTPHQIHKLHAYHDVWAAMARLQE